MYALDSRFQSQAAKTILCHECLWSFLSNCALHNGNTLQRAAFGKELAKCTARFGRHTLPERVCMRGWVKRAMAVHLQHVCLVACNLRACRTMLSTLGMPRFDKCIKLAQKAENGVICQQPSRMVQELHVR